MNNSTELSKEASKALSDVYNLIRKEYEGKLQDEKLSSAFGMLDAMIIIEQYTWNHMGLLTEEAVNVEDEV